MNEPKNEPCWSAVIGAVEVRFGDGVLDRLGAAARELGGRRALLVTDGGIVAAGHAERARSSLLAAGLEVAVFDAVAENPTTEHVAAGVETARAAGADLLVGLGGGSAMDCAKGINFLLSNGGRMEDYWGHGKASRPMLPAIGVPTTAGTGSEAQRYALISQADSHVKMACGDPKARFATVLLDPELLASLPRRVAAATAIDAVAHAVESYVTTRRNPISQLYAREAWRLLEGACERFLADRGDRAAGADMLLGAHLAGAAIEASMLGIAHSCANPLTARFGLTHGVAVGLMLPHVVRFNGAVAAPLYGELARAAGLNGEAPDDAERLARRLDELRARAGLPARLGECGVAAGALPALAGEAAGQWTAQFNPRPVTAADLERLYAAAL
ncbi:MAG: iron-containing alcohol dehydrogenase [Acidobacteria bacterium]|nr:MAG: iron-containing alcohol dehydrogenase [Acidobacteriota bacterium]